MESSNVLDDTAVGSATSPPPSYQCAICKNPSTGRCALCKSARYCSGKCQIAHWRQGHKQECHPPEEETVISQRSINQRNRVHSGAYKRGNLVKRSSYESPFLNSNVSATELHAKCESVKFEFDGINDSESSNASFFGFSSSPDTSESSDDSSLYESSSSVASGQNNSVSPRVAHEIFIENCAAEIPQRPKPGYSKSAGYVDSLNGSTDVNYSKTRDSGHNYRQVELRSITASFTDDKVMLGGSSNLKSLSLSGSRERAHGPTAHCNAVDVSSPCSTPVSSGIYNIDLFSRESSPNFSFSLSEKCTISFSQDSVKEVYDVLPRRSQGGSALVDLNKGCVPSVKCESCTNSASISKPLVGSLSHVSLQANGSSKLM